VQFTLAQIIVKAKGTLADLKAVLHFNAGFIAAHNDLVKRLAVYADGFGTNVYDRWHDDANWIAKEALNKPVYLPLADSASVKAAWINAALDTAGANVELLWLDARSGASISGLCALADYLAPFLKPDSTIGRLDASQFRVTVESVPPGAHK